MPSQKTNSNENLYQEVNRMISDINDLFENVNNPNQIKIKGKKVFSKIGLELDFKNYMCTSCVGCTACEGCQGCDTTSMNTPGPDTPVESLTET